MTMKVATGHVVRIDFELKVKGGDVLESSKKSGPVQYTQGEGKMLTGLEQRIAGMTVGEEKKGEIPAKEAFGTEETLPTKDIPRAELPKDVVVGAVFQAKGPTGQPIEFKVVKVDAQNVTVRFLHPLAGKDLEFWVKVLMIDDPKAKKRESWVPPPPADAIGLAVEDGGNKDA
jgi:FKBP-type peptidyl-prolyl cis-trans isomerase 2